MPRKTPNDHRYRFDTYMHVVRIQLHFYHVNSLEMFCKNKLWKIALSPNQCKRKTFSNIYRLFYSQTVVVPQVISMAELLLLIAICKPTAQLHGSMVEVL